MSAYRTHRDHSPCSVPPSVHLRLAVRLGARSDRIVFGFDTIRDVGWCAPPHTKQTLSQRASRKAMSARRWSATALVRKLQDVHWAVGGCRCLVTHALAICRKQVLVSKLR